MLTREQIRFLIGDVTDTLSTRATRLQIAEREGEEDHAYLACLHQDVVEMQELLEKLHEMYATAP